MFDALDFIPQATEVAFLAIGENDTGRHFAEDIRVIAAECALFVAAPAEWLPSTCSDLLTAHENRGKALAEQAFLTAWATRLAPVDASEFAGIIGYLAGLAVVEGHLAAGNTDRTFVEMASWTLEDTFHASFARLLSSGAIDTPRTVN